MAPVTFGKYVVTQVLGSGGMAEVYAGIHPDLGREVAIKVILPQFATEHNFEERFRREARLVASLRHPHIVQVYDFDVVDGRYFMVMEYLAGGTLKDHLRALHQQKAQPALPEIADLLDAIASALDYAHGRGAIHRDIKPANILFTVDHVPVLSDFGIAKLLEEAVHLTATGGVVGSPFYMSPEQATGGPVDARSDQYSLGVVLYEMTTGRMPFQGSSAVALMTQHLNNAPPAPRTVNPTLSTAVEAVLLKVLAKQPENRFGSCGELAQAFRRAVEGQNSAETSAAHAADNARTLLDQTRVSPDGPVDALRTPTSADDAATVIANRAEPAVRAVPSPEDAAQQPPAPRERAGPPSVEENRPADAIRPPTLPAGAPPKPTTQNFGIGGIQAGVVNQGGEQTFSGDLTFNLNFSDIKTGPPQAATPPRPAVVGRGGDAELAVLLEALRRSFAESARVDRFVRLVTQFHNQLEALPAERAGERGQVLKRVQALLMEMTEAKPDPDLIEIMGTSLERSVQPLSEADPDLPTLVTRITRWGELLIQPE